MKLILDILDKGKVDTYGLTQVYDTYKKWHSKGLDLALFIQQLQIFNCGKPVTLKLKPLDAKYIEQVVTARNNLNEHIQFIKSYAQSLSVHDFTVSNFKGLLDLMYLVVENVEIKPTVQDLCMLKLDGLLLKTSLGSSQYDGRPSLTRFPPSPLTTMGAQRKGDQFQRSSFEPILSKYLRVKKSASAHNSSIASQRPVSYAFGEDESNHFFRFRVDFIRQLLIDSSKVEPVYDQRLFEVLYDILGDLNAASTFTADYLQAIKLLSELELTINIVVEHILDELELKSSFPLASAAKAYVQSLRQGSILDYGTLPGQAEYVAHRVLSMNPGIGAASIECLVSIFDQSWTMSSLKSISDLYTYPFEVQAGIAPNLYALFERATMIQDELPQEHPGVNDESILILAQAMIHAHISSSAITGNPQAPLREWLKFHELASRASSCKELRHLLAANTSKLRLGAISGYDVSLAVVAAAAAAAQAESQDADKSKRDKAKGKQAQFSPPSQVSKPVSHNLSLADRLEVEGSQAVSRKNWPASKPGAITDRAKEPKRIQDNKANVERFSEMSNSDFGKFFLKILADLKVSPEDQSRMFRVVGDSIVFNSRVDSEGNRKTTWIDQKLYDRLTSAQKAAFAELKTRTIEYAKQLKEPGSKSSRDDKQRAKAKARSGKPYGKQRSKHGARVNLSAAASDSESGSQSSIRSQSSSRSSKSFSSLREFLDLDQPYLDSEAESSRMDRKQWFSSKSSKSRPLLRECADTFEDSFDNDGDRVALLAATRAIRELEVERRRERQLDSQRLKREFALGHEGISDQFMQLQLEHKQLSEEAPANFARLRRR